MKKNVFIYVVRIICLLSKLNSFNSHMFLRQLLWFHRSLLVLRELMHGQVKYCPWSHAWLMVESRFEPV